MVVQFYYVTDKNSGKVFITNTKPQDQWSNYTPNIDKFLFDGVAGEPTFNKKWVSVNAVPKAVEVKEVTSEVTYFLSDKFKQYESDKFPAKVTAKHSIPDSVLDEMYEASTNHHYSTEPVLFVLEHIGDFDVKGGVDFAYTLEGCYNGNHAKRSVGSRELVQYDTLSTMFLPSIMENSIPCSIDGPALYGIIRAHIKEHINPDVARVTKDYDFAFEVSKVIPLGEPAAMQFINAKGRSKSYIKTENIVPVFEMTPSSKDGSGYTPVPALVANNKHVLKGKLDELLDAIMQDINRSEFECPCCKGRGTTQHKTTASDYS